MTWLLIFFLGWHPPLEVDPNPPMDFPANKCQWCQWSFVWEPATEHEVLTAETTYIDMWGGSAIILVTPEQMRILKAAYPRDRVHDGKVVFMAPDNGKK